MDSESLSFLRDKWRQAFVFHDVNNDGFVNKEDFIQMADYVSKKTGATAEQAENARQEWMKWLNLLQPGSSESLDEETFVTGMENLYKEDRENYQSMVTDTARHVFDRVDLDGNGLISREELDIFYEGVGRTDKTLTKEAFDHIDKNGDGLIQRDELVEDIVRHFCNSDPIKGKSYFFLKL